MGLYQGQSRNFVYPSGFELSPLVARGDAVLMAWDAGHTLTAKPLRRFDAPRSTQNSLLRLVLPVNRAGAGN